MTPGLQSETFPDQTRVALTAPPAEPLFKIRPGKSRLRDELCEAWAKRELLYFLVWKDLKIRYRQTFLGLAWVLLQPILMTVVFTVFISKLGRISAGGTQYVLFAYAGLLPWTFFANSVSAASASLLTNSYIITRVYFPRLIIPAAMVGVRLVDFLIASIVLFGLMIFYGVGFGRSLIFLPLSIVLGTLFTLTVSAWFSALHVKYRDLGTLLPVLIQLWMFMSPIIYPIELVPPKWRLAYSLNPLVGIIEMFRASFLGLPFDWKAITVSAATTFILLAYVVHIYYRWESKLIDVL